MFSLAWTLGRRDCLESAHELCPFLPTCHLSLRGPAALQFTNLEISAFVSYLWNKMLTVIGRALKMVIEPGRVSAIPACWTTGYCMKTVYFRLCLSWVIFLSLSTQNWFQAVCCLEETLKGSSPLRNTFMTKPFFLNVEINTVLHDISMCFSSLGRDKFDLF